MLIDIPLSIFLVYKITNYMLCMTKSPRSGRDDSKLDWLFENALRTRSPFVRILSDAKRESAFVC